MKKMVLLITVALTLGASATCFAAAAATGWLTPGADGSVTISGGTNSLPNLILKPSANVKINWGVETTGVAYSLGTAHTSGTFTYCTTSTETNIYRYQNSNQASPQGCPDSPPDANSSIAWGAGWTASK